ncbi:MAG TPA: M15 family metallopeptidase, partial [Pseudonocardiaceae bacterium]|nr:M15 family metallopeptidase [Pseudonocardiaceae bacterium]
PRGAADRGPLAGVGRAKGWRRGGDVAARRQSFLGIAGSYSYEWLTVDPVAAGAGVPEQPPLPPIPEPATMPRVTEPADEPMVRVVDRGIQLPAPYWHVGWPAAVTGTYLRADVARRLVSVVAGLPDRFGLAVLDGWRPLELQRQIYRAAYQDPALPPGFVSEPSPDPQTPPPHLTGGAVDVTLTYRHRALALGTQFDAFTARAASTAFETIPGAIRELRRLLTARMLDAGFVAYQQEWWHFEYGTRRWAAVRGEQPRYGPASPPQGR